MCIVVDACAFSSVFNSRTSDHVTYKPIFEWLANGCGKMVYGGTKYKTELRELKRYLGIVVELRKAGKVIEVDSDKVDKEQKRIEKIVSKGKFNDAHLVAIVNSSGCLLVCTKERDAIPFIKDSKLYSNGVKRPRLYTTLRNKNLLCDKYFADICLPKVRGCKVLKKKVSFPQE